jgi:glycosyltransferase involved in cell wall biosynthesis
MRVLFNGASTIRSRTGVGQTTLHLHVALAARSPGDRFWLYPGDFLRARAGRFLAPRRPGSAGTSDRPGWLRSAALSAARHGYAAHFNAVARLGRFDLYHEPNLVPFAVGLPTVVTVHDLSVVLHPEWHPADRVRRHERAFHKGIERAAHVVVVSETVRAEAIRHLGLEPGRITTVYNGISAAFRPPSAAALAALRGRLNLPERYLLYVGTIEPRKNVGTLLRAYCDLPAGIRAVCPLLLGGKWGWKSGPERTFFETEARHRGVRSLGYVPDDDLPALYGGAAALLYPSFYEGFGLPPVEAMACGTAAVVSTADAVREVVGCQAVQLDPNDVPGWREAMRRAIVAPESLAAHRRGGPAHAARFDWARAAETTLSVYRRVLGIPSSIPAESGSARAA